MPLPTSSNPSAVGSNLQTPAAQEYIKSIQSKLGDLQAQQNALTANNFTDTNQLQQNAQGQYVPSAYEAAKSDYTKAYQDYINTLNPSQDVVNAQNTYNQYIGSENSALQNISDQTIPMRFITGQQKSLESRAQNQANLLQGNIGIAQQNQQARQNAGLANVSLREKLFGMQQSPADLAKAQLDTQKTQADIANTQAQTQNYNRPISVSAGSSLFDPKTGKFLGTAPNGSSVSETNYAPGQDPVVDAWVANINSNKAKLSDITGNPALKSRVAQGLAQSIGSGSDILSTTKQSLDELNSLVNNESAFAFIPGMGTGFSQAVGAKGISSFFGFKKDPLPGTAAANFNAKLNQVKNDVILPNLNILHGLGRVTDREFQALSNAITSLSTNLSESAFKSELKNITDRINEKLNSLPASGGTGTSGQTSSGIKYTIIP